MRGKDYGQLDAGSGAQEAPTKDRGNAAFWRHRGRREVVMTVFPKWRRAFAALKPRR